MDIGAADRHSADSGEYFIRARWRGRHVLDLKAVGLEDDESLHGRGHIWHGNFLLDDGHRIDHRTRGAADLEWQSNEQELVDAVPSEGLEVEALHQVDSMFDEQQRVDRLGIAGRAWIGSGLD